MQLEHISTLAAQLYRRRQRNAVEAIRTARADRAAAQSELVMWLAIACVCGADLPELVDPIADYRIKNADGSDRVSEREARALVADTICHRSRWAERLGKARDKAINANPTDPEDVANARALMLIAIALGPDPAGKHPVPPFRGMASERLAEAA